MAPFYSSVLRAENYSGAGVGSQGTESLTTSGRNHVELRLTETFDDSCNQIRYDNRRIRAAMNNSPSEQMQEEAYDDSPWTREELEVLVWDIAERAGWEAMDEIDQTL